MALAVLPILAALALGGCAAPEPIRPLQVTARYGQCPRPQFPQLLALDEAAHPASPASLMIIIENLEQLLFHIEAQEQALDCYEAQADRNLQPATSQE